MESDTIDLNILKQIADETCTISFEAWRRVRAKGYVEGEIINTPDGVYGKLSERGAKLLYQSNIQQGRAEEWAKAIANGWAQLEQSRVDEHVADVQLNQRLRAENATLRQELKEAKAKIDRLTDRGSLIAWAIETSKVWIEYLQTSEFDESPSKALSYTLNVLTNKVSTYKHEHPIQESQ